MFQNNFTNYMVDWLGSKKGLLFEGKSPVLHLLNFVIQAAVHLEKWI